MINEKELPEDYVKRMKDLLGKEYDDYIKTLKGTAYQGLRVNLLKLRPVKFMNLLDRTFKRIPWAYGGFYIDDSREFTKSPYYYAGLYYIQEPSAMASAALSLVEPGDKVLDLCAAPGGKTTQLAALMGGEGVLVSNDISSSRAKALLKNIELAGVRNCLVTCEEPAKLAEAYPDYFDKILIDAPCSGEGMFRKDRAVFNAYLNRGSEHFVPLQKKILEEASKMLRPGGAIIYSTCTYSVKEDEEVVLDFLKRHDDYFVDNLNEEEIFTDSELLKGSVRLLPHKLGGEGHFVARIIKNSELGFHNKTDKVDLDAVLADNPDKSILVGKAYAVRAIMLGRRESSWFENMRRVNKKTLPQVFKNFLRHIRKKWDYSRFHVNNEYIYYLPAGVILNKNIRYIRTGLLLGRVVGENTKSERFEPSQALAMSLKLNQWKNPVNLSINDSRVIKYLKGETIDIYEEDSFFEEDKYFLDMQDDYYNDEDYYDDEDEYDDEDYYDYDDEDEYGDDDEDFVELEKGDGYRLVCVENYPLGFAKQQGLRLKNKYYAGWRMN